MALPKDLDPNMRGTPDSSGVHLTIISPAIQVESHSTRIKRLQGSVLDIYRHIIPSPVRRFPADVLDTYRHIVPSPVRTVIAYTSPALVGLAIATGAAVYGQAHGADQPRPKIERATTTTAGPKSTDDCEAFSAGDLMFDACMEQRELRKRTITP